jgi:hypothetical protein
MFGGKWATLLHAHTTHSLSSLLFVPPTLHASKWIFPTYEFPFHSSRTSTLSDACFLRFRPASKPVISSEVNLASSCHLDCGMALTSLTVSKKSSCFRWSCADTYPVRRLNTRATDRACQGDCPKLMASHKWGLSGHQLEELSVQRCKDALKKHEGILSHLGLSVDIGRCIQSH